MATKGNCANWGNCDNLVDRGDIEVRGEGFVCSTECAEVVEQAARETASDKAAWYDMDR